MTIVSFPIGKRRFAPSWWWTLLTIAVCVLFVRLGNWQWDRGAHVQAEWDAFTRGTNVPMPLGARSLGSLPRYGHISVTGTWDAAHQFLIDNRSHDGEAGYEVLTPLQLPDGRVLLVDRGWVAFTGSRARLPIITIQGTQAVSQAVSLAGRLDNPPVGGLAFGRAAPTTDSLWPKVTSFPTLAQLALALHHKVEPWMLLLDRASPDGYLRDWQPPGLSPLRHWSYALQWWLFAVTLLVFWVIMSIRRQEPRAS